MTIKIGQLYILLIEINICDFLSEKLHYCLYLIFIVSIWNVNKTYLYYLILKNYHLKKFIYLFQWQNITYLNRTTAYNNIPVSTIAMKLGNISEAILNFLYFFTKRYVAILFSSVWLQKFMIFILELIIQLLFVRLKIQWKVW